MKRLVIAFAVLLCLCLATGAGIVALAFHQFHSPHTYHEAVTVDIPSGTGFSAIVERLATNGVIPNPLFFKALVVWYDNQTKFRAGEYRFESGMSPHAVMQQLVEGRVVIHSVTVREGLTSNEVLALLMADDRLRGLPPATVTEGSLLPETYQIHRRDARADLIGRMQKDMDNTLLRLWETRQQDLPFTTPQEALTLASVVEKETGVPQERGRVAAVFINRLRRGMPLQSDPTVVYGIEKQHGPLGRSLLKADLKTDHLYNTYLYHGLPPGPIANPGLASIEAVLNPPHSDELYFVATGTGGHHFARTLAEHNANVRRYRAALKSQKKDTLR